MEQYYYRYDFEASIQEEVKLYPIKVLKDTPKGVWVLDNWSPTKKRFIRHDAVKKYAYPTHQEALNNLIERTKKRVNILENDLYNAKNRLKIVNEFITKTNQTT